MRPPSRRLAAEVRNLDSAHPLLYVGADASSLSRTVRPFEQIADFVGADTYPIGTAASISQVGHIAAEVQQLACGAHAARDRVAGLSWAEYPGKACVVNPRWPTQGEMRAMRDEALAEQSSLILWYSICDVLRSDDPARHWRDLVQAAFAPRAT